MKEPCTFSVQRSIGGWRAEGLFSWQKEQLSLLGDLGACTVVVADSTWLIKAMDHLDESMRGFRFEHVGKERATAIFPHASETLAFVHWENEPFHLTRGGAYVQLFSEAGDEALRISDAWKDSDRLSGIEHRIEIFKSPHPLLAVIALGWVIKALRSPALYVPPNNSVGLQRGRRPCEQNKAVLPWIPWG